MNTNNNNNLQSAVYGNQINAAIVATRQTEQPNNGSGSNNNVNNSNSLANQNNQNNPANQPHLRGSEQNSNSPKVIEQSQTHNNIRHSIDQNNNHSNSNNGNNNNAPGQKAIGSLFDQTNNSNKQAQVQPRPQIQGQDSLKPIESSNSNHKDTNSVVLADSNNQKSNSLPLEKLLDKNSLEAADEKADDKTTGNDFSTIEHTAKESEESLNASKKARRPKTTTSSNPSKSETEQSTITFSISTKEKKQIEAVATLLDYESSNDFLKELISQGLKKYLDATTQALKTA